MRSLLVGFLAAFSLTFEERERESSEGSVQFDRVHEMNTLKRNSLGSYRAVFALQTFCSGLERQVEY